MWFFNKYNGLTNVMKCNKDSVFLKKKIFFSKWYNSVMLHVHELINIMGIQYYKECLKEKLL